MKLLNKINAASLTAVIYASTALPVFAQSDLCPEGELEKLCTDASGINIATIISTIVQILLIGAVVVALFFLIWGGIKWITSGGDKAKVESARSTIIGAIIGLVIAFAAFFVLNIVAQLFGLGSLTTLTLPTFLE